MLIPSIDLENGPHGANVMLNPLHRPRERPHGANVMLITSDLENGRLVRTSC